MTQRPQELQRPDLSHTAQPLSMCLNGCQNGTQALRGHVFVQPPSKLCPTCVDTLDTWLRQLPDTYTLLPTVIHHGSIPTNPHHTHTRHPDPPAPLRLEILDLLDTRRTWQNHTTGQPILSDNHRGIFGTVLAWSSRLREERRLERRCDCGHQRARHRTGTCFCGCTTWHVTTTLTHECALLHTHLTWVCEQPWVSEMYAELRPLMRALTAAVGDYRPKPVGFCVALIHRLDLDGPELCGGPLYRDDTGRGVRCGACGDRTDPARLRDLGSRFGLISDDEPQEASG